MIKLNLNQINIIFKKKTNNKLKHHVQSILIEKIFIKLELFFSYWERGGGRGQKADDESLEEE